jgi:hypothetical protein
VRKVLIAVKNVWWRKLSAFLRQRNKEEDRRGSWRIMDKEQDERAGFDHGAARLE